MIYLQAFSIYKVLQDLKIRYRRLEVVFFNGTAHEKSSIKEHEILISALKSGDLVKAEKTIHSNWKKSLDRLNHRCGILKGE